MSSDATITTKLVATVLDTAKQHMLSDGAKSVMKSAYLNASDYVVIAIILVSSILIGVYHGYQPKLKQYMSIVRKRNSATQEDTGDNDEITGDEEQIETDLAGVDDDSKKKLTDDDVELGQSIASQDNRVNNYLNAHGSVSIIAITFSLMASFFSSTGLVGTPTEVYMYGIQTYITGYSFCLPIFVGAFVTGPFFSSLNITSVFEYFELRYENKIVKLLANFFYILRTMIFSAIIQYGPVSPVSLLMNVNQNITIGMLGLIGTIYTSIGGIKGVIWADLFQSLIMLATVTLLVGKGIYDADGVYEIIRVNRENGRTQLFDFNPDPFVRQSFWSLTLGGAVYFSINYCFDQQMLQRFKAAKSRRQAQAAMLLNIPIVVFFVSCCCFIGLIVFYTFRTCDPLYTHQINNNNQYSSLYVAQHLHMIPGALGLFLAAIFCSALSSLSSTLNSITLVIWEDLFMLFPQIQKLSDKRRLSLNKLLVVACGAMCTLICYLISLSNINLFQLNNSLVGVFNAPLVGLFVLSMFFSCTNKYGAIVGALVGLFINLWLSLGALIIQPVYPKLNISIESCNLTEPQQSGTLIRYDNLESNLNGLDKFYGMAYFYYTLFGACIVIIVGVFVSIVTGGFRNKIDTSLLVFDLTPFCNKFNRVDDKVKRTSKHTVN